MSSKQERTERAVRDRSTLLKLWTAKQLNKLSVGERALVYEEIIETCLQGFDKTAVTPKGDVITYTEQDFPSALKAMDSYTKLIDQTFDRVDDGAGEFQAPTININVTESHPEPR